MIYKIKENISILVIGDLMIDHYIYGNCNRISPEAPVQIVEVKKDVYTLGGAGNVLQNLVALNCRADIISVVGNDDDALRVEEHLQKDGISATNLVKDNTRCTTVKSRVMVQNHQLLRLDKEVTKTIDLQIDEVLQAKIAKLIKNYDVVLVSDYNKGLLSPSLLAFIFNLCRANNIKTLLDPKGLDFTKYKGVSLIKPNKKEAIAATGIQITDNKSILAACLKIKEITGCEDVVITMSEDGIAMYSDGELKVIPTKALGVVDVTGAGDTVLASLGGALASGYSLFESCHFANHAAAIVVSKVGSATATLEEINS